MVLNARGLGMAHACLGSLFWVWVAAVLEFEGRDEGRLNVKEGKQFPLRKERNLKLERSRTVILSQLPVWHLAPCGLPRPTCGPCSRFPTGTKST